MEGGGYYYYIVVVVVCTLEKWDSLQKSRNLSCFVQLKSFLFNPLCVFDLFSKGWQSTLFEIFFFCDPKITTRSIIAFTGQCTKCTGMVLALSAFGRLRDGSRCAAVCLEQLTGATGTVQCYSLHSDLGRLVCLILFLCVCDCVCVCARARVCVCACVTVCV